MNDRDPAFIIGRLKCFRSAAELTRHRGHVCVCPQESGAGKPHGVSPDDRRQDQKRDSRAGQIRGTQLPRDWVGDQEASVGEGELGRVDEIPVRRRRRVGQ